MEQTQLKEEKIHGLEIELVRLESVSKNNSQIMFVTTIFSSLTNPKRNFRVINFDIGIYTFIHM